MDSEMKSRRLPVLLMLHGGGPGVDAESNWRGTREVLAEDFECLTPDLLGFGASVGLTARPLPGGPTAWARHRARQILGLMDRQGIDKAYVLGNSAAGGAAALELMAAAPSRVIRAVVMGGAGTAPMPSTVPFYEEPTIANMRMALARLVADPNDHVALLDQLAEERFERAMLPGAEGDFRSMFMPDPGAARVDLARITCPVLAVHGEKDRVSSTKVSEDLAAALPHGTFGVVPGAGHWIHIDRPADFTRRVTDFLAS